MGLAYGVQFGTSWFAKEGLFELYYIPITDKLRDYRKEPTEDKKQEILKICGRS